MLEIRQLTASEATENLQPLAQILLDCVAGGASVSFMDGLTQSEAEAFFRSVIKSVEKGDRILLAAFLDNAVVGTVQIITAMPPNQPHRADVAKLLVSPTARKQGIASRLMQQAETAGVQAGKTLLVLDTIAGSTAEKLYLRLGWTSVGIIPNYAMMPDGHLAPTHIFYKQLA